MNNPSPIVLASGSEVRQTLLRNAAVPFETIVGKIDEHSIKEALVAEGAPPRDIADALAEGKARKVSQKYLDRFVIGCDQTLSFKGKLISKAGSKDEACSLLKDLSGEQHKLLSAAVIYEEGKPVWRHVGEARMNMERLSDRYIEDYVERNWQDIQYCVGCYMFEAEGIRLFSSVQGDYFTVLGMPMMQLLAYLRQRGMIET